MWFEVRPRGDWPTIIGTALSGLALAFSVLIYFVDPATNSSHENSVGQPIEKGIAEQAPNIEGEVLSAFTSGVGLTLLAILIVYVYVEEFPQWWQLATISVSSVLWIVFSVFHMPWYIVAIGALLLAGAAGLIYRKHWG